MTKKCCNKPVKPANKDTSSHPDYTRELSRLNRVAGQIDGVKKMISERRYCVDILIQLRAVRAAVHAVEASILEAHMDSCVTDAMGSSCEHEKRQKIDEIKALYTKYSS